MKNKHKIVHIPKLQMQARNILSIATAMLCFHSTASAVTTVQLGISSQFAVLSAAGITNTEITIINGDVGAFPTASITGFSSVTLNGVNHTGDAVTQNAKGLMTTAYSDAYSRLATTTYTPVFDLGGLTLASGVFNDPSSFAVNGTLTLDGLGDPNSVWIFQAGSTLITGSSSKIKLINGANASNVFWQVGSDATLGSNSSFNGTVLAKSSISLDTGATETEDCLRKLVL